MDMSEIKTSKTKARFPSSLFRRLLCLLGIHKWESIYTRYSFDPNYGIDWDQYCLHCPAERENPVHLRR